jgi:hypothetical protein
MFRSSLFRRSLFPSVLALTVLAVQPLQAQNEAVYAPAQSGGGRFGLGFVFGEPTGVNAKLWQTEAIALDAGLAWSAIEDGATTIYGDLLWHQYGLLDLSSGALPVYFGAGARFQFADDTHFGIRTVVGLDYILASSPFDVFLELVPTFDLAPETDLVLTAAVGFRYFFR